MWKGPFKFFIVASYFYACLYALLLSPADWFGLHICMSKKGIQIIVCENKRSSSNFVLQTLL